jgi:hypothetical protein
LPDRSKIALPLPPKRLDKLAVLVDFRTCPPPRLDELAPPRLPLRYEVTDEPDPARPEFEAPTEFCDSSWAKAASLRRLAELEIGREEDEEEDPPPRVERREA